MELRMRVQRIVDFGVIVGVIGVDAETGKPVTIYVDHRPFQPFCHVWQAGSYSGPNVLDAEQLTLSLNLQPDQGTEGDRV